MKFTGIIKKVDELGRVILPREIRKSLEIQERDTVEIYVEDQTIFIRPFREGDDRGMAGILRNVDEMGRVVLPKEIRESFGAPMGSRFAISVDRGCVLLNKYEEVCLFCANTARLKKFRGKAVCQDCIDELAGL